jgi:hypothetical protein
MRPARRRPVGMYLSTPRAPLRPGFFIGASYDRVRGAPRRSARASPPAQSAVGRRLGRHSRRVGTKPAGETQLCGVEAKFAQLEPFGGAGRRCRRSFPGGARLWRLWRAAHAPQPHPRPAAGAGLAAVEEDDASGFEGAAHRRTVRPGHASFNVLRLKPSNGCYSDAGFPGQVFRRPTNKSPARPTLGRGDIF